MKLKRCLSAILAVLLSLSLMVPSFASDLPESETLESIAEETTDSEAETRTETEQVTETETETETEQITETETETEQATETETETEQATETETEAAANGLDISSESGISSPQSTVDDPDTNSNISVSPDSVRQEAETIFNAVRSSMPATYSLTVEDVLYMQLQMTIYINLLRESAGVEPIALYPALSDAAMVRAAECQTTFNENHTRPDGRGCFTVLTDMNIPYGTAGENIAKGQPDVLSVMNAWYNSPGHLSNMLRPYFQTVGVGMDFSTSTPTWTQIFTGGYTVTDAALYGLEDTYSVGTSLQETGLIIYLTYSNGVEALLPVLDTMISGYDPNTEGTQNITITAQGMSGTFTINVVDPVKDFVSRLYTQVLGRQPDASGLNDWTAVLRSGKEQGAKVAQGFVDSDEFKKRNVSDTEYITILYRTFLDREPDSAGLNAWQAVLDSGLSRMHVFKGFAESDEFTQICSAYGITRGNAVLTAPMDQNEGVTKFIVRCYRLCLGREADTDGLNAWCNQILTGANTAKQAAHGFVFSDEFKNKNLSDTDFVKTMYRVFMDREADGEGLNNWVRVLQSGQSREHVFNGFADSPEFREICASYGIN